MHFISDALRGDFEEVTKKSFDCLMCGLCAARCPAGIAPYNIALLCRRLYGKYLVLKSKHLEERVAEIKSGKFDAELSDLKRATEAELKELYSKRDIEK